MIVLHEFLLKSSDRKVRLTKTHLLLSVDGSFGSNYFSKGIRYSATRKEVKRILTSSGVVKLGYRDWGAHGRVYVRKFRVGLNIGCQQFRGAQARLLRKWAKDAK